MNSDKLFKELRESQRSENVIPKHLRLNSRHLLTIASKSVTETFNTDECIVWTGYIRKFNAGNYKVIPFSINGRLRLLHRLLYLNFVGELSRTEHLRFECKTDGCCNYKHLYKCKEKKVSVHRKTASTMTRMVLKPRRSKLVDNSDKVKKICLKVCFE